MKVIHLDIFHLEVGVFTSDKDRRKFLRGQGIEAEKHSNAAFASAHMDVDPNGRAFFSMVIKPEATKATWAHECVHIADFVMDRLGIPTDVSNTEVRAYIVGRLFAGLQEVLE